MENKNEEVKNRDNGITIVDLFNIILKNWMIIFVTTFLVTLTGVIYATQIVNPKYASTAHVLVTVNTSGSNITSSNVANDTTTAVKMLASVAEIMELDPVLESVIDDLNLTATTAALRNAITVTYGSDQNASLIITVKVEVNNVDLSQKISSSVVANTVEYITKIQDDGSLKGVELVDLKDASEGTYSSPNKKLYVLFSLLAGLALGCVIVFLKELFDTRVRTEKDIISITNKEIIGLIPHIKVNKGETFDIPKLFDNYSAKTAYSKLQSNIKFASIDQDVKAIMITSSTSNENKSTVVSNLANQYAETANSVLILDLDLRKPTIHKVFNIPNDKGIAEYVSDDISLESIIQKTDRGIDVITAGDETQFVDKILTSNKLLDLIANVKDKYDYIIVDSAPLVDTADALKISSVIDGIIFVIRMNYSNKKYVTKSMTELVRTNANVLGVVTTNNKTDSSLYYSYYKKERKSETEESE